MKKIISAILIVLLLLSFGATSEAYSDVASSHWGYPYISQMTNLQYLVGYPDGSFKPEVNIRFTELMTTISKFHAKFSGKDPKDATSTTNVITKYGEATIQSLQKALPNWAHSYVFYALDNGIVSLSELTTLKINKKFEAMVNREDTMTYFARAMKLENQAAQKTVIALPYKDSGKINAIKQKYIAVLLDLNVLSPEGKVKKGVSGNFYPQDSITRAEMSKILSLGNNAMGNPSTPVTPTPQPTNQFVPDSVTGVITRVNSQSIEVKTDKGVSKTLNITSETQITLEGSNATASSLKEGQTVDVYYNLVNNEIKTLKATTGKVEFEGYISKVDTNSIEVQIQKEKKTFKFDSKSDVTFNGKSDSKLKIEVNDYVKGSANEDIIEKLDVEKLEKYSGRIRYIDTRRNTIEIDYKVGTSERTRTFAITDKIVILKDAKTAELRDLERDMPVILAVKDDNLLRIETNRNQSLKGVVKSIEDDKGSWRDARIKIVITQDKTDYTVYADNRTRIRNGGSNFGKNDTIYVDSLPGRSTYRDPVELKAGDNIEAQLSYDYIDEFTAWRTEEKVSGVIKSITTSWGNYPSITVRVKDTDRTFQLTPDTKVNEKNIDFNNNPLANGMQVDIILSNDVVTSIKTFGSMNENFNGVVLGVNKISDTKYEIDIRVDRVRYTVEMILNNGQESRYGVRITNLNNEIVSTKDALDFMDLNASKREIRIEVYGRLINNYVIDPISIIFDNR